MPVCKREGFDGSIAKNKDQTFHDNDEVFFCEVTKEIFRDYDDYFRHVMAINSTVWQCEATGRENLTYAEALSSEKRARKKMEMFKDSLRPPVMLVMEEAKQSSVKALHTIIFKFVRRRFFIGEEIQALTEPEGGRFLPYQVKEIVPTTKTQPADGVYEDTESLRYKVKRIGDGSSPAIITVPFENLRRQRFEFTSDNLQMFIKSNITRVDGILRAKPESYKKYVTDRCITFASIFIGKMPHYTPAKIKKPTTTNTNTNDAVQNKKQSSMKKFVTKNNANEKLNAEERAKLDAQRAEKARTLKEEMERVRREKQERLFEAERVKAEKKAKLLEKIEEECNSLLTKTDDLERSDQRLLPKFTPIQTLLPTKYLGDSFMLREFMHSFASILSGLEALRGNLSFFDLSRALTQREVAGPLSDVVRILLGTIFDLQKEEEEDYTIEYLLLREDMRKTEPLISMSQATRAHNYVKRHFSMKINELPMDAMTLSEILRLHLLSSGACVRDRVEKLRQTYRNGYTTTEDPGLALRMQHPHVLHVLKMYTLYQLPMVDIMRVLRCLMAQILTYGSTINILEERNEQIVKARVELRTLMAVENRRLSNLQAQKRLMTTKYHQQIISEEIRADNDKKLQLKIDLDASIAELMAQGEREQRKYNQQIVHLHSELFNFLVYLGMDRAYRRYYAFESMPGIFIEHSPECDDVCLNEPPINLAPSDMLDSSVKLPKNKKDLRSYLLKKYTDEEKSANKKHKNNNKTNNNNNNYNNNNNTNNNNNLDEKLVAAVGENKENLEQTPLNGLPNGVKINGDEGEEVINEQQQQQHEEEEEQTTTTTRSLSKEKNLIVNLPTQYELYMCTGDRKNCIVHDERNTDRQRWSFIYKQEDIDALIEALNPLGERESLLREQLSSFRELIFQHVRKCPFELLTIDDPKSLRTFKNNMLVDTQRRYNKANMGFEANADINDVMHASLVDRILQFETAIFTGDLGHLKVKDMVKWRQDLLQKTYDPQVKLQWGPNEQKLATSAASSSSGVGAAAAAAVDEKDEEDGDAASEDNDEDMDDIKDKDGGRYANNKFFDPGQNLGQNLEIDSEDSADEGISLHDSNTLRMDVKHLASALLQVEQSIERRFFKEPFGAPLKQIKDKEFVDRKLKEGINRLKQWEVSLMESTSYSQVFLHLNLLHDSIMWARSTAKSYCQVCRRGSDPDKMLLCDECNGGTHMFCMKPKMKVVPEGNWYCLRCVKLLGLENNNNNNNNNEDKATSRRKRQLQQKLDEEDAAGSGSEGSAASSGKSTLRNGVAGKRGNRALRSNEIENILAEEDDEVEEEQNEEDEENEAESDEEEDDDAENEQEEEEEEEDNDEESNNEDDDDSTEEEPDKNADNEEGDDDAEENDDDNVCSVCSYDGGDLNCTRCKVIFHLECANLKRPPRYNFVCNKCKTKDDRKRKKLESNEEDDTDFTDTSSDPPLKRARQGRSSLRNSVPNGVNNEYGKTTTSSNRRSHRRTGDNLPLNSPALYDLLEDVMKHEQAWPFLRPVMQSEVPDYYTIIKHPMDFAKVKSKLNMGEYQLNEEVMNDIQLIFNNCDHYNHKGNEVYEAGAALERYVIDRCKKHNFAFSPSDMNV